MRQVGCRYVLVLLLSEGRMLKDMKDKSRRKTSGFPPTGSYFELFINPVHLGMDGSFHFFKVFVGV